MRRQIWRDYSPKSEGGNNLGPRERKEREKEQRREDILSASEKLFLSKGLNGTTMDEIAKECELSKGTLYLYFQSKEQMYLTITHKALTVLFDTMAEAVNSVETTIEKLQKVGESYLTFFNDYPDYFHIMNDIVDYAGFMRKDLIEVGMSITGKNNDVWNLITNIVKEGVSNGLFREDTDPLEIAVSLWANSTIMLQMMDHVNRNREMLTKHNDPFVNLDFIKIIHLNATRIVISIMNNPPADTVIKNGGLCN
jgi:TetR/AcrR family transcriptional regulator